MTQRPALERVFVTSVTGVRQGVLIRAFERPWLTRHRVHLRGEKRSALVDSSRVHRDEMSARAALRRAEALS